MKIFLIGLFVGMFLGYAICDLLTKESSIVYHIKKLRAKKGASITVEAEAVVEKGKRTKAERKQDRVIKRNQKKRDKADKRLEK